MKEIEAMAQIAESLEGLYQEEIERVLRWAADKYDVSLEPESLTSRAGEVGGGSSKEAISKGDIERSGPAEKGEYHQTVADFFYKAEPATDAQKALVIGYWLQTVKGQQEINSFGVNAELKQLGHQVGNITRAFNQLMGKKPQLVIQTRKTGSTKQARRKFKLTSAGMDVVKRMVKT